MRVELKEKNFGSVEIENQNVLLNCSICNADYVKAFILFASIIGALMLCIGIIGIVAAETDITVMGFVLAIALPFMLFLSANTAQRAYLLTDKGFYYFAKMGVGSHTYDEIEQVVVKKKMRKIKIVASDLPKVLTFYAGENFERFLEIITNYVEFSKFKIE